MQAKLNQFKFEPRCNFGVAIAGVALAAGGLGLAVYQATKKPPSNAPKASDIIAADDAKIAALQAQLAGDQQAAAASGTNWTPIVLVGSGVVLVVFLVSAMKNK